MTVEPAPSHEAVNHAAPRAEEYAPAEHTAAVIDGDAIYVVDLRDSRVLRLTGLAALAWERASGLVSGAELESLIANSVEDPAQVAAGIRNASAELLRYGLLEQAP